MRLVAWLIVPLVLLGIAAAFAFQFRDVKGTFSTSNFSFGFCQANEEIAEETRTEINSAALEFMELFARAPLEARGQMSRRGQNATSARGPLESAQVSYNAIGTIGSSEVTETYLLRFVSGSESGLRAPCDFNRGPPIFVSRGGTPTSAIVLFTDEIAGESQRTTSVWLERERGEWRVRALNFGLSRIVGQDSEELWAAARQQRARDHQFNAFMLYVAAQTAAQRGDFYQARMMQDFNADYRTFVAPEIMQGTPPFSWRFGDETFRVANVQYTGFGSGDVGLIIDQAPAPWTESAEAEAANRRLMDGFIAAYPEWRETFDAIVVRSTRQGSNQTWGTVYTAARGYSEPPNSENQGGL